MHPVTTTELRGMRRLAFTGLLASAMAASTFTAVSLGLVATFIIDDLGITRGQLGLVIAVIAVLGALLSPAAGWVADRLGGKTALVALFLISAATYAVFGVTVAYVMLLLGGLLGAVAEALANPSTNKLIAEDLPAGERGIVTGVKQSGVQAGIFLGGVTVPSLAVALGWRGAFLLLGGLTLLLVATAVVLVPPAPEPGGGGAGRARGPLPPLIRRLAVYGALLGFAGSVTYLVPLYAEEALGYDPRVGGLAAAVTGLVGVGGRIWWSHHAERSGTYARSLAIMAGLTVVGALAYWSASVVPLLLWVATVFTALGSMSWNSVGMLAVMAEAGPAATGRASGVVLLGFLAGLGAGPPIFGWTVDVTGSYAWTWAMAGLAALAAGAVTGSVARATTRE